MATIIEPKIYKRAYIYKIINTDDESKFYIGSTNLTLNRRFAIHKAYCNSGKKLTFFYEEMRTIGTDKFKIEEVIKLIDCDKKELLRLEGEYQKNLNPYYNLRISGRTNEEYRNDNRIHINESRRKYYNEKKEDILEKQKQFYTENKELHLNRCSDYYYNVSKFKKFECECSPNVELAYNHKSRHMKSKRHIEYFQTKEI